MNIEKIKEFINLKNEIAADDVIGFHFHDNKIHVRQKDLKGFENLQIKYRGDGNYPFEVSVNFDGFEIFALIEAEDIKEFPQLKDYAKNELLTQLADLENGEEVTA